MNIKLKPTEIIAFLLLALFSVSLLNMGGYFLVALFLFYFVVHFNTKLVIDRKCAVLLLFSVIYIINYSFYWSIGIKEIIIYLIAPWGVYLFGHSFVKNSNSDYAFDIMTVILALGLFVHGMLNFFLTISMYGFNTGYRISMDFWRKEFIAVTGCSLYYVPLMGLSVGYLFEGKNKFLKMTSILSIVLGMTANLVYVNRTAVYLMAILIIGAILTLIFKRKILLNKLTSILLISILLIFAFTVDLGGIRSFVLNLDVVDRIQQNETGRLNIWLNYIFSDWWLFPFGGKQATVSYGFAHNLWLDVFYTVGYIPFILLVIFTFQSYGIINNFNKSGYHGRKKYIYLIFAMMISSFVEPVIDSNPYYFLIFIMIIGGMSGGLARDEKRFIERCTN